ncbi:hypothetical protein GCM10029992_18430 [Glycomyces albus]
MRGDRDLEVVGAERGRLLGLVRVVRSGGVLFGGLLALGGLGLLTGPGVGLAALGPFGVLAFGGVALGVLGGLLLGRSLLGGRGLTDALDVLGGHERDRRALGGAPCAGLSPSSPIHASVRLISSSLSLEIHTRSGAEPPIS